MKKIYFCKECGKRLVIGDSISLGFNEETGKEKRGNWIQCLDYGRNTMSLINRLIGNTNEHSHTKKIASIIQCNKVIIRKRGRPAKHKDGSNKYFSNLTKELTMFRRGFHGVANRGKNVL